MKKNKSKRKNYVRRVIALFLAINILAQVVSPSLTFALTSGPSQPEVQSFEPIEANTMVNDFTGDFDYNIPLMTVPGPNGGYPINMSYHAGIMMDQEASWCGLGWNINPGVITRNMRGLPDDFNGDLVEKEMYQKPQRTYSIGGGVGVERQGGVRTNGELGAVLRYDNYKGLTLGFNGNISGSLGGIFNAGLSANFDPQSGIGLNPNIGIGVGKAGATLSASINSRNGLSKVGLGLDYSMTLQNKGARAGTNSYSGIGAGTSFGSVSMVPNQSFGYGGFDIHFLGKLGTPTPAFIFPNGYAEVGYKQRKLKDTHLNSPGYGYLNYQNHSGNDAIFDYNKDNNGPVSYDAPALEMPVSTYDIYAATGQGVGGTFRPFRSDIGVFHDPTVESSFNDTELGADFGAFWTLHIGGNLGDTYSQSYSGMWKDEQDVTADLSFDDSHEMTPESNLYVPHTYFKAAGELTANSVADNGMSKVGGTTPVVFDINMELGDFLGAEPHAKNKQYGTTSDAVAMPNNYRTDYEKRDMNMHYRSFTDLDKDFTYDAGNYTNIYSRNANPSAPMTTGTKIYDEMPSGKADHHIAELSVYKNDGMKYVYGLPVYNTEQHEYVFNLYGDPTEITGFGGGSNKWIPYSSTDDAAPDNNNGEDEFYSQTKMPAYVHSYMLTAIFSPDYVDLTGNGPTEDDFGYYVKFNYSRTANYQWRTPIIGAKYDQGYISHDGDQKGTFMYGKKDVYYLNSVETKSHIAVFTIGDRKDSYGPAGEHVSAVSGCLDDNVDSPRLQRLNAINLYSKRDLSKPIKTVSFKYDYSLCRHVINNTDEQAGGASADSTGKLTLKKVTFTYQGNTKGALSPYEFSYASSGTYTSPSFGSFENPDYDPFDVDRWGNYKPQAHDVKNNNYDNPYVDQKSSNNNAYAAAWNLKKIKLPSGAEMKINYEADDYGYVQDKRAMQMCVVTGVGNEDCSSGNNASLTKGFCTGDPAIMDRVYFELLRPTNDADELAQYFEGMDNMYFKVFMQLKKKPGSDVMARDYVEGYCKIEDWGFPVESPVTPQTHAWVRVKFVPAARTDDDGGRLHPFRRAAFEYMKLKRPDLFFPPQQTSSIGTQLVSSMVNLFTSFEELLALGYYHACVINGYAESIFVDQSDAAYRPSFIRLNNPLLAKIGGGHRVGKIEIADNWNLMDGAGANATYGQEYKYVLDNGKSSGVAEYEPLVGGDENPWKQPSDRFAADRKVINRQKELYSEEPYGESLFPGANVGYSRIVVKNIDHGTAGTDGDNNARTENGVSVKEFYTAKDFPVKVTYSEVKKQEDHFSFSIPFVGSKTTATNGFSQGFVIELNDMHGKPKSEATYSYSYYKKLIGEGTYGLLNQSVQAVSKTNYVYNTTGTYNPNAPNYLNNTVSVMEQDGIKSNKQLGVTYDFNVDMNENSEWTLYVGDKMDYDFNLIVIPAVPVPVILPLTWLSNNFSLQYSDQMSRTIVSSKVIMRNGILKETQQWHEGSYTTAKNLVYDANTGAPLLTTITNEFDKPVYNYEYKANWYYPDMKNNGTRYRYMASGTLEPVSGEDYFKATLTSTAAAFMKPGDILLVSPVGYTTFYGRVTGSLSSTELKVMPEGLPTSPVSSSVGTKFVIIKPIESNQQSISSGFITSLHDPTQGNNYQGSILNAMNDYLETHDITALDPMTGPFVYIDPCTGEDYYVMIMLSGGSALYLYMYTDATLTPPYYDVIPVGGEYPALDLYGGGTFPVNDFSFYATSFNTGVAVNNVTGVTYPITMDTRYNTTGVSCIYMDGVIRAAATTFTNSTTFDYTDINTPDAVVFNNESGMNTPVPLTITNTADNPYRFGRLGVWRVNSTYTYLAPRAQTTPNTNIAEDGTVRFRPFNWTTLAANNPFWSLVNTVSLYSPHGFELENKDVLGNYSSALYGYNNQLPVSVASNAPYYEQAFDGFEDYGTGTLPATSNKGHMAIQRTSSSDNLVLSNTAHTGKKSLNISGNKLKYSGIPCSTAVPALSTYGLKLTVPSGTKKYVMTFWTKTDNGNAPTVTLSGTGLSGTPVQQNTVYRIEGWKRTEVIFEAGTSGTINIEVDGGSNSISSCYLDDIRIQPFTSSQKTFVYDPNTLWLVAELDERNFATFYNYDEEGALTQVKKETVNGISTIKSVRKNTYNH